MTEWIGPERQLSPGLPFSERVHRATLFRTKADLHRASAILESQLGILRVQLEMNFAYQAEWEAERILPNWDGA